VLAPVLAGGVLLARGLRPRLPAPPPGGGYQQAVGAGLLLLGAIAVAVFCLITRVPLFRDLYYLDSGDLVTLLGRLVLVGAACWLGGEIVRAGGRGRVLPVLLGLLASLALGYWGRLR
jgi:hypothetical protein